MIAVTRSRACCRSPAAASIDASDACARTSARPPRVTEARIYLFIDQPGPPIDGTTEPWVTTAPPTMNVALRTGLPVSPLARTLERAVREVNPSVPMVRLREMDAVFSESISRPRLLAQLLGAFAGLALLLAAVGTYGVLSFIVAERRREIAIRLALGAARGGVLAHVIKQGLTLTALGVIIGVAGALGLNRLIASLLFGVRPTDLATLSGVVATIALSIRAPQHSPPTKRLGQYTHHSFAPDIRSRTARIVLRR